MSFAVVSSRANVGMHAPRVAVECHLSNGLPQFAIVGLPETAVKESKDRVRSALLQSGFEFPRQRITVNLAPADLPKEGGRFDLPIAISVLLASNQLRCEFINQCELVGELALDGSLRAIKGILPFALATQKANKALILPQKNAQTARLASSLKRYEFTHFLDVCAHLSEQKPQLPADNPLVSPYSIASPACLSEVCGQPHAKRALEIAASGGHSLLMIGPPGTGKTLLASRLPGLLPPLTQEEALETAAIVSVSQQGVSADNFWKRPFRRPHHTASAVSLVGGGRIPTPGEISLAHNGVLFLDELPEFNRHVLEVLREPLESGVVHITRAAGSATFPARFQLLAAMNPCPCGYLTDVRHACHCSAEQIIRYKHKLSGPLLDRIDMHIEVPSVDLNALTHFDPSKEETSLVVQQRVLAARARQTQRGTLNARLTPKQVSTFCTLEKDSKIFLTSAMDKLGLSARAYHRVLKVAKTIADLNGDTRLLTHHLSQALSYRKYDRQHAMV